MYIEILYVRLYNSDITCTRFFLYVFFSIKKNPYHIKLRNRNKRFQTCFICKLLIPFAEINITK